MQTSDFSNVIVLSNLVIGILLVIASEKLFAFAGNLNRSNPVRVMRLTRVANFAFGATVAILSAFIYIAVHVLKLLSTS